MTDQVTWGNLLNLLVLIVSMLGLAVKITSAASQLRVTIEQYHRENSERIATLEAEVRSILTTLARMGKA